MASLFTPCGTSGRSATVESLSTARLLRSKLLEELGRACAYIGVRSANRAWVGTLTPVCVPECPGLGWLATGPCVLLTSFLLNWKAELLPLRSKKKLPKFYALRKLIKVTHVCLEGKEINLKSGCITAKKSAELQACRHHSIQTMAWGIR